MFCIKNFKLASVYQDHASIANPILKILSKKYRLKARFFSSSSWK